MNYQQVQDIRLMYEAVYNNELREKAEEYNSMIRDEDILEVATEYFYTYGLNSTGVDILIEKVGLDNFVEFVYDLSEGLILTEAKKTSKAKKQPSMLASQRAKLAAQKAAKERTESERKEPASKGPDTEAKSEQPKSKKPEKGGIRGAIERGMERHRLATTVASKVAQKAGPALGKGLMHGVGGTLGLIGKIASSGLKEEFEYWVNSLIEEGYDLSDYTWDDMYEYYVSEAKKPLPTGRMSNQARSAWVKAKRAVETGNEPERKKQIGRYNAISFPDTRRNQLKSKNEEVDLYDIIFSHLLDEGYADTNEDALAIMANMSEEWKENILDEEVRGAKKGTIRSVIEKGGKSIKYVQSGGDIVAGDRAAAERASAADRKRSGRNRANAARAEQARKKSIQNLNAKSGEDSGDYDSGYYGDDDTSDGKRHYSLSHTNRDARRRRASGR